MCLAGGGAVAPPICIDVFITSLFWGLFAASVGSIPIGARQFRRAVEFGLSVKRETASAFKPRTIGRHKLPASKTPLPTRGAAAALPAKFLRWQELLVYFGWCSPK